VPRPEGHVPFAPALLRLRFPSMTSSGERAHGFIDDVNGTGRRISDLSAQPTFIPRGAPIFVSGWIYVPDAPAPPEIVITVDGAFGVVATGGYPRPDVAAAHGPDALNSGFEGILPSGLADGPRTIAAAQLVDAMTYRSGPERQITIGASALSLTIQTPIVDGVTIHVDYVAETGESPELEAGIPSFGHDATFSIVGWAADHMRGEPAAAVYALVDDVHLFRGRIGAERPDVAEQLDQPPLRYAGYEVRIDAGTLALGDHVICVIALSADGEGRAQGELFPFAIHPG